MLANVRGRIVSTTAYTYLTNVQDANDSNAEDDESVPFHEMGLDDRILKAIAKMGWRVPTLIQVKPCHDATGWYNLFIYL